MTTRLLIGDVFDRMAQLDDHSFDLIVTSPPFLALRTYLPDGHPDKAKEIGSEPTPAAFLDTMLALTAEWRRLLAPHGSIAVELGDTYAGSGGAGGDYNPDGLREGQPRFRQEKRRTVHHVDGRDQYEKATTDHNNDYTVPIRGRDGWPLDKSLTGIPTLYAWSLAYGRNLLTGQPSPAGRWLVRNLKPWIRCLDIDTVVYVRTPTGDRPMRLLHLHQQFAPGKFKLWNGQRWTEVTDTQASTANDAIELEFRTGERIACTRDHRWPIDGTNDVDKLLRADELTVGDVVLQTRLPDGALSEPAGLPDDDIGWLAGVFLGDGSFDSRDRIQIAGHRVLDAPRAERLTRIATAYDGTCSTYEHGNENGGYRGNVVIRSRVLAAAIRRYIGGDNARNKHLTEAAWRRSDIFLRSLLMGYLESDGHYDQANDRWRLGFTDNPWLARDLRTIAARLGASCIIKRWRAGTDPRGGNWSGSATHKHRGEIRFGHRGTDGRSKPVARGELVAIRQTKRRSFIDVAVADDPHLFALASGLLTHNSNPPVGALGDKERPATSYITVACTGSSRWFDLDAVRTPYAPTWVSGNERLERDGQYQGPKVEGATAHVQSKMPIRKLTHEGAPPLDWWHHVDAIIDTVLDERAGKKIGRTPGGGRERGNGDGPRHSDEGAYTVGARGVHIRRALEKAGILTTVDAYDVSPRGYQGAHYAVWPPELVRLMISEMCPRRVCMTCGVPSRRIVGEATYTRTDSERVPARLAMTDGQRLAEGVNQHHQPNGANTSVTAQRPTLGWSDCGHGTWRPGRILDPFVGSGTTLAVASGMGRDSVGIDLDERNADLARERVGMFLEVEYPEREVTA